jgi:hypothetical protein
MWKGKYSLPLILEKNENPIMAILFRPFGFIASKALNYLAFPVVQHGYTAYRDSDS